MPACASHLGRYSGESGTGGHQSVTNLNATGQRGEDLLPSAQFCARVAQRLDETAEQVRRSICTGRERRRPHFLSCLTQIGVSHFDYNHARDWNTTAWARIQLPGQLMVQAAAALGPAGVCAFSVIDLA